MQIAAEHPETVSECAGMSVEKWLLLDRIALHSRNIAPGNVKCAAEVKTNFADPRLPVGNRAAMSTGIAAHTIAIQLFPQCRGALADARVGRKNILQCGHTCILRLGDCICLGFVGGERIDLRSVQTPLAGNRTIGFLCFGISHVRCEREAKAPLADERRILETWSSGRPVLQDETCCSRRPGPVRALTRNKLWISPAELHAPPNNRRQALPAPGHAPVRQRERTTSPPEYHRAQLPRRCGSARPIAIGHPRRPGRRAFLDRRTVLLAELAPETLLGRPSESVAKFVGSRPIVSPWRGRLNILKPSPLQPR